MSYNKPFAFRNSALAKINFTTTLTFLFLIASHVFNYFYIFSDPPEIEIDQTWVRSSDIIESEVNILEHPRNILEHSRPGHTVLDIQVPHL